MGLSELEWQRARKRLEDWLRRRNAGLESGPHWCLCVADDDFLVQECPDGARLLRLSCNAQGRWRLYVPLAGGGWSPYPGRPEAASIDAVIEELEQAPLHVHW